MGVEYRVGPREVRDHAKGTIRHVLLDPGFDVRLRGRGRQHEKPIVGEASDGKVRFDAAPRTQKLDVDAATHGNIDVGGGQALEPQGGITPLTRSLLNED